MLSIKAYYLKRRSRREYLNDSYSNTSSTSVIWFKRIIKLLLLLVLALFVILLGDFFLDNTVRANSIIDTLPQVSLDKVSDGSLLIKTHSTNQYQALPLLQTDVVMNVSGMIVRSRIKQHFKNITENWVEAIYVFPLPETAAVDHLRMQIGERIIIGEIKEKQAAKRIYEAAKRQGKKTALVEQQRPNLFTNSVANIAPGETIVIEIEYQQVLQYQQGEFSLTFPMAITPRYIPGKALHENINFSSSGSGSGWSYNTDQVKDASHITPPVHSAAKKINPVSINITLDTGFPLEKLVSRYHAIKKLKQQNQFIISLADTVVPSDHDFELVWTPKTNYAPKAAIFHQTVNGDHFQMLMLVPPDNTNKNQQALARNVTYIIDTSGSMYGTSMEQAKQSLLMALERLRLHDKFNIIQFNSTTDSLFSRPRLASFENRQQAKRYIRQLHADGGTEMAPALKLAFQQSGNQPNDNNVHQIIFLTDGSVGNERALFGIIHKNLGNSRLFTVGIGSAPNRYFMRKAAQYGRGTFTYIGDVNEVNEKMDALFSKLESPLMTRIKLKLNDSQKIEMWPKRIPDLYAGEPVILAIKLSTPLTHISLTGSRALTPWSAVLDLQNSKPADGIGVFWAREKIAALNDSLHEGANKDQVREDIIQVALKHHLVSKHTSLVAVEQKRSRPLRSKLNAHALPLNLPKGQSQLQSFGRLAQTATPAKLNLIFGFSLLMLGLALSILLRDPVQPWFLSFIQRVNLRTPGACK